MSMSTKEQELVKRFLNYYCTILALIIGIIVACTVFYANFTETFEYPEEEYQIMDQYLKKAIDVEHGYIKYNLTLPDNMKVSFGVINSKPSISISMIYENKIPISSHASFNTMDELIFDRSFHSKDELNQHNRKVGNLFSFLVGTICFLVEKLLLAPLKKYVIRLGTKDQYNAIKESYLKAGKKTKTL